LCVSKLYFKAVEILDDVSLIYESLVLPVLEKLPSLAGR